ncbi:deoxyribose-phosphate aldolase [Abditibacteriota bacterium]|nr:deoxyribose-phosphate aldolase [Abditibacteriota bacterium]
MTRSELASFIDHTVLKPDTRAAAVEKLCEEAREYKFAAVCVPARWVSLSASLLKDTGVLVATVVGFPHGDTLSSAKADETRAAIEAGADEVDMVISIGAALDGDWDYVQKDIAAVVEAAAGKAVVKVIFENAYLDQSQIALACRASQEAGADYVKTSTGFAASGAKVEEVRLMRQTVGDALGVKAAGGIRDLKTALAMIEAGASRLGCSASIAIVNALPE